MIDKNINEVVEIIFGEIDYVAYLFSLSVAN